MKLSFRIWILIVALVLSLLAIGFNFESGVLIKSVEKNSSASEQGMISGEIIKEINGIEIKNKEDYTKFIESVDFDGITEQRIDIKTKSTEYVLLVKNFPEIIVDDIPRTRIKTGLDLRGGARALVQPDVEVNDQQLDELIQVSRNRLNVYGLSDVQIRGVKDLEGNRFMLVEVAGATPSDLEDLISKQGKFEAKVGNVSVFEGGSQDIRSVCRNDATCSGIRECNQVSGGYACNFDFVIYLSEEAAQKHADITAKLNLDSSGQYLSEKLYLYVDDSEVDSLLISAGLKGQKTTQISIQGSGSGATQEEALTNAKESMNKLQTIMITGSLPYKLTIVKLDTISPSLGEEFNYLLLLAGLASIIVVSIIVFARYRKIKASLALLLTSFSELIIILGVAALINWNLDLPSIAGILATIATGVDSQIVIIDEAERKNNLSIKEKIGRALFVIFVAYGTSVVSLIPLGWAGAGLFKGFAITTIIGITAGVFISRPAFADMIRKIEGNN